MSSFCKRQKDAVGQKRDQWMLEAWVGGGTINGSEMFCILIVAVVHRPYVWSKFTEG